MFFFLGMEEDAYEDGLIHSVLEEDEIELEMRRGINIGNALEAPNEGDWGVYIRDEFFR